MPGNTFMQHVLHATRKRAVIDRAYNLSQRRSHAEQGSHMCPAGLPDCCATRVAEVFNFAQI